MSLGGDKSAHLEVACVVAAFRVLRRHNSETPGGTHDKKTHLFGFRYCLRRSSGLLVISPDHCVRLADGASFVAGIGQHRIGDLGPHALAFSAVGFLVGVRRLRQSTASA